MPKLNHLHTFERSITNKLVYRCVHPECGSFYRREALEGKKAHCKCGNDFIITNKRPARHFQYAELKCDDCRSGAKSAKSKKISDALIDDILNTNTGDIEIVMKVPAPEPKQLDLIPEIENQETLELVPTVQDLQTEDHEWDD